MLGLLKTGVGILLAVLLSLFVDASPAGAEDKPLPEGVKVTLEKNPHPQGDVLTVKGTKLDAGCFSGRILMQKVEPVDPDVAEPVYLFGTGDVNMTSDTALADDPDHTWAISGKKLRVPGTIPPTEVAFAVGAKYSVKISCENTVPPTVYATDLILEVIKGRGDDQPNLPPGVTVTVTPDRLGVGEVLTIEGTKFPADCQDGTVRLVPNADPNAEYQFGPSIVMVLADWKVSDSKFTRPPETTPLDPPVGTYAIKIYCIFGNRDEVTHLTGKTVTFTRDPTSPTTAAPAPTTTTPPVDHTTGTVSPTTAKPGVTEITVRGGGFGANQRLEIALATKKKMVLGATTSNVDGLYAATLKLPADAPPGDQKVTVSGLDPAGAARVTTAGLKVEDLSCSDFPAPEAAQAAMGSNGSDPHGLDPDGDGFACVATGRTNVSARSGSQTSSSSSPGGALAKSGTSRGTVLLVVSLAALTAGALLIGLSHPAVAEPVGHRRSRRLRRPRRGQPPGGGTWAP